MKIRIKKSKRGTFTAAAKKRGMSVQEFARQVLANKENYSPAMVKKANFARNAAKWNHENGGHLAQNGMYLNVSPYIDTSSPYYSFEAIEPEVKTPIKLNIAPLNVWKVDPTIPINLQSKEELDKDLNTAIDSASKKAFGDMPNDVIDAYLSAQKLNINRDGLAKLRYIPTVGAGFSALTTALQPIDYSLPNELRGLSSQFRPIGAPHIGGYRRYNPYDINLGDAENIALTAATINANRGQGRATQGALNTAAMNAAQRTAAQRNLAWQQANEEDRLNTDTYNLGIDRTNLATTQAYDQLNQQINNNRINMLARAAQEADNTRTAWSNMYNATHENFFNQLGNVGRDEWNRNQFLAWLRQHPAVARDMGIDIG